jgi:hypothetical protein
LELEAFSISLVTNLEESFAEGYQAIEDYIANDNIWDQVDAAMFVYENFVSLSGEAQAVFENMDDPFWDLWNKKADVKDLMYPLCFLNNIFLLRIIKYQPSFL